MVASGSTKYEAVSSVACSSFFSEARWVDEVAMPRQS